MIDNPMDSPLDLIESDFAKYRKEEIRKRNNTNKKRSRAQELAVAKYLGAARVPMSGAGMLKGDGLWNSGLGLTIYECKYSAATNIKWGPTLRLPFEWFDKLEKDAKSMNARFSFLVLSFFNQGGGYPWSLCFIDESLADVLLDRTWVDASSEYQYTVIDERSPISPKAANIYYKEVRLHFQINKLFPCTYVLTDRGKRVILPLWALKQRVEDVAQGRNNEFSGTPAS